MKQCHRQHGQHGQQGVNGWVETGWSLSLRSTETDQHKRTRKEEEDDAAGRGTEESTLTTRRSQLKSWGVGGFGVTYTWAPWFQYGDFALILREPLFPVRNDTPRRMNM